MLPYAPDSAYGTPDDLKELVDTAHGLGLMMFLDVVYNHFGPDGNYLGSYAPQFFRDDVKTPWGPAIDFRRREVRDYFTCNVLMWLTEFRFDGLRFDAVHAIQEQDWIEEMAAEVRATIDPDREVHLVLEHHNAASHLRKAVDAQWNDERHHVCRRSRRSGEASIRVRAFRRSGGRCGHLSWRRRRTGTRSRFGSATRRSAHVSNAVNSPGYVIGNIKRSVGADGEAAGAMLS